LATIAESWSLGLDTGEDRGFLRAALLEERADKTSWLLDRPAMPRPMNFVVASQEFFSVPPC
jgi:hypothetical protein